jgi:hypothetical protein
MPTKARRNRQREKAKQLELLDAMLPLPGYLLVGSTNDNSDLSAGVDELAKARLRAEQPGANAKRRANALEKRSRHTRLLADTSKSDAQVAMIIYGERARRSDAPRKQVQRYRKALGIK